MGSLSMMGKSDYRQPPGILYGGPIYHVPYGDAEAVEKQLDICQKVGVDIAALLFEPIQGEAGGIVPRMIFGHGFVKQPGNMEFS